MHVGAHVHDPCCNACPLAARASACVPELRGPHHRLQVRLRAGELRTSLVEVVNGLSLAPERLQWEDVLKQYAAINYQA